MNLLKRILERLRESEYDRAWNELEKQEQENPFNLKGMKLKELCDWTAQWGPGSANRLLGMNEMKRRESVESRTIARIALLIAVGSFLVAALNTILSHLGKP